MIYGQFEDSLREFVITRPDTPWPWINYLGTEDFFSIISSSGGGYSFFKDARLRRLTRYRYNDVPLDSNGRLFYIRDGDTVWSPGWRPTKTPLDSYECRHGMGYTRIASAKNGVSADITFFVPLGANCEVQRLRVRNTTRRLKTLRLFAFTEFCLWDALDDMTNYQRNLNTGEVEVSGSAIYHVTEYRERRNHFSFYSASSPVDGFETDREAFVGRYGDFASPAAVRGAGLRGGIAAGWSPVAAFELRLDLAPLAESECVFLLGYCENPDGEKWAAPGVINKKRAELLMSRFDTGAKVDGELARLRSHWDGLLGGFSVKSGDERLDRMVNVWNQYQCMVTYNISRSASGFESGIGRGIGFRDTSQDLLGCVHQIPRKARQRLFDVASTQLEDGGAYHQYQPLTKRGNADVGGDFNDDPLWLILGAAAYLKETGDWDFLEEQVPFDNDPSNKATLFEHLRRSFQHVTDNRGPHGLPLIGRADWNDCLNLNCFSTEPGQSFQTTATRDGRVAESLLIAGMFVLIGQEYAEICRRTRRDKDARLAEEQVARMREAVLAHGWDGEWFLRAYDARGGKVGSRECAEGRIFIESNGWCAMAGIGAEKGYPITALDSVKKHLDTPYGIVLLDPPYSVYHVELGEVSSYPPSYKENAGIFCHSNPWIVIAECMAGRPDRAFERYSRHCPAYMQDRQELHRMEPYVYSQMIAGKNAARPGEAKNSWLTGTAAWNFVAVTQWILGIRPEFDGLRIEPCLPREMKSLEITRVFRGCRYLISIVNSGKPASAQRFIVDGAPVASRVVPPGEAGSIRRVVVEG